MTTTNEYGPLDHYAFLVDTHINRETDQWGVIGEDNAEEPTDLDATPIAMLERSRYGQSWITLYATRADAIQYHGTQEYAEDWSVYEMIDLRTNAQIDPWAPDATPDPIALTDGPIIDVQTATNGRSFDGENLTIPEIAARIALLIAGGKTVTVTIAADDPECVYCDSRDIHDEGPEGLRCVDCHADQTCDRDDCAEELDGDSYDGYCASHADEVEEEHTALDEAIERISVNHPEAAARYL